MHKEIILENEAATVEYGVKISRFLRPGSIVCLHGSLGAGKTTLVRGIVQGLGGDPSQVHSPTFSIVHQYECPSYSINHCDFYRLEQGTELQEFGGLEFFSEPKIYLLEWAERVNLIKELPPECLSTVYLQHDSMRRILRFPAAWKILD